jgi:dihydroorotate dehydrogenase
MYAIVRRILFWFPPEAVHYFSMNALRVLCSIPFLRRMIAGMFRPTGTLTRNAFGLSFPNPVMLAAGFDKNARYLRELETLGFGCVEIGTVTPLAQEGNPKPRLFRLPKDGALINRMGFNNDGVKVVVQRLRKWRETQPANRFIVGGNIGKNKVTANEDAYKDYEICFQQLFPWVDYFVVNVSSPNTPGLRALQEKESLRKILSHLQALNVAQVKSGAPAKKPILLKIAPDLTFEQIDDVVDLALEIKLDGLVACNTSIGRNGLKTTPTELEKIGAGGLSGAPIRALSTNIVEYIARKSEGQLPIIASGGIFTGADALEKINAGATMIQVWTGFIYKGPSIVRNICRSLNS